MISLIKKKGMKKRQKKPYDAPAMDVVVLPPCVPLLTGSDINTNTVIDDWDNGGGEGNGEVTY